MADAQRRLHPHAQVLLGHDARARYALLRADAQNVCAALPRGELQLDGTATPLPESIGKCVKALNVPVVMIRTYGAFARDPLYNGLQKRRTKVSAQMQCLLSSSDVAERNVAEINERIFSAFRFDNFPLAGGKRRLRQRAVPRRRTQPRALQVPALPRRGENGGQRHITHLPKL